MYDRKKVVVAIVAVFAVLLVVAGVIFIISTKFGPGSDRKVPFIIKGLEKTFLKDDKAEVENQVYKQVIQSLVVDEDKDQTLEGVIREGTFKPGSKKKPVSEKVSFTLDVEKIKRSWVVLIDYKDGHILPSGIRTDCLAPEDRLYGEDISCVQWSMSEGPSEVSKTDPLFKSVPYKGSYYRIDALGKGTDSVSVVVRIGMIYTADNERVVSDFELYRQSSIKWLKEKSGGDLLSYEIDWRDSNNLTVVQKKKNEPLK